MAKHPFSDESEKPHLDDENDDSFDNRRVIDFFSREPLDQRPRKLEKGEIDTTALEVINKMEAHVLTGQTRGVAMILYDEEIDDFVVYFAGPPGDGSRDVVRRYLTGLDQMQDMLKDALIQDTHTNHDYYED